MDYESLKNAIESEKLARLEAERLADYREKQIRALQEHLKLLTRDFEMQVDSRTQELEEARDQAIANSHAKSEFLANMSHEIRTPMNGVLGMLHVLKQSELNDRQRGFVTTATCAGELLLMIINDILDFSKIEAKRLVLEDIEFNTRDLFEQTLDTFAYTTHQKHIELLSDLGSELPTFIKGDPTRLRQIITNLLSNAIKFTEKGHVLLGAHYEDDHLTIKVQDTGIGMTETQQRKIFDAFSQADSSTTRKHGGTGLGLAICSRLCKAMGGTISVQSEEHQGSVFSVRLPFVATSYCKAPQEHDDKGHEGWDFSGYKVLLVDDTPVNLEVAKEMLALAHLHPMTASNGQEAITLIQEQEFDLVLMDLQMPVLDGLSACRQLREMGGRFATTPIVAMTAHALTGDRDRSLAAGMNEHITKPLVPSALYQTMALYITPHDNVDHAHAVDVADSDLPESLPGIDLDDVLGRVCGRWNNLKKILISFSDTFKHAGRELRNDLERGDLKASEKLAHSLKGSGGNVGARILSSIAGSIERHCKNEDIESAKALLEKFDEALHEVLNSIESLHEETVCDDSKPLDTDIVKQHINDVAKFFEIDLAVSQNSLDELKHLCGNRYHDELDELETAFHHFDDQALHTACNRWLGAL